MTHSKFCLKGWINYILQVSMLQNGKLSHSKSQGRQHIRVSINDMKNEQDSQGILWMPWEKYIES